MAKGETEHHSWRMGFCTTVLLPLLGALLLLSPPKLDLDPITSLVASVVTLSDRVSEALGVPTIGSFNPVDNPAGVAQVRERLNQVFALLQVNDGFAIQQSNVTIEGVPCILYKPTGAKGPLPVLVYFHGGGYVVGSPAWWHTPLRSIVNNGGVAVVNVDYSLSPEVKFPVPALECASVVAWLSSSGASLGLDQRKILIGGDSAGGALALSASLRLQATQPAAFKSIVGLTLLYPWLDLTFSSSSLTQFADGYVLSLRNIFWFKQQYLKLSDGCTDSLVSAAFAADEQLAKLPPVLIITAEKDPLRDEGEAFGRRLASLGVPATTTRYNRTVHAFLSIPLVEAYRPALAQWTQWVKQTAGAAPAVQTTTATHDAKDEL